MKKIIPLSFCVFLLGSNGIQAQTAWDVIDTLAIRQIGPGVKYTHVYLPAVPVNAYLLETDLTNPYISIETMQAFDQVGKTERLTEAFDRMSSENHHCLGGINGNFWIVPVQNYPPPLNGMPHSGSMHNGQLISDPNNWNRGWSNNPDELLEEIGFAMLDDQKRLWVDDINYQGRVEIAGKGGYVIDNVNRIRYNDKIVFFNSYVGLKTRASDVNGIEVFIKPKYNQSWGTNKDIRCEVTRVITGYGEAEIKLGESALSGAGNGAEFLKDLKVGSEVTIRMDLQTRKDTQPINVMEMLTGNALVMKNGRLTMRNYNEDYNATVYPRTGIGQSEDGKKSFFIVMDRKAPSRGASTEVMCEILRKAGATSACSLDGGGSAQMMIDKEIVNYPGDGTERAVANGWMLFHNAPQDEEVVKIGFAENISVLPQYATYAPTILGYNQYGVLVNKQFKEYDLSCSPGLGEVKDNMLVLNGKDREGILTANCNGSIISKKIRTEKSDISFRYDSLIIDKRKDILINLYASLGNISYPVDVNAIEYEIEDESICRIESGNLIARENGETFIYAALGTQADTLKVKVQTSEVRELNIIENAKEQEWIVVGSSNFLNPHTTITSDGLVYTCTYTSGRAPNINIKPTKPLYGLPDTVKIILNTGEMNLSKINIGFSFNNKQNNYTLGYENIPQGEDYAIVVPINDLLTDKEDYGAYPVKIDYIQSYLKTTGMQVGKEYKFNLKKISLIYNDLLTSILPHKDKSQKYWLESNLVRDDHIFILTNSLENTILNIKLYSLAGEILFDKMMNNTNSRISIDLPHLAKGTYLMTLKDKIQFRTFKIIVP